MPSITPLISNRLQVMLMQVVQEPLFEGTSSKNILEIAIKAQVPF
jgi:hypothetical protein